MGCWELVLVVVLVVVQGVVQGVERVGGPRRAAAKRCRVQAVEENITGVAAKRLLRTNQTSLIFLNMKCELKLCCCDSCSRKCVCVTA